MSYNIVNYFMEICSFLLIMIVQFHHDRTVIVQSRVQWPYSNQIHSKNVEKYERHYRYEIICTTVYSQINEAFFFIYGKKYNETKIAPLKFCIYWNIFEQWKQLKNKIN